MATATTRPAKLGQPFTRWSLRKLVTYLRTVHGRVIRIGREALRCLLARRGFTFQRTKTWKESTDPERDTKPDRIEHVLEHFPGRVFAFDEFGPLGIRPTGGSCWAKQNRPDRVPATYHRTHGVTYFHGCYSVGDDTLWGINRRRNGAVNSLTALKSIRASRPDGAPIYVIMDNLSAHKGTKIRAWAKKHKVELCFTPADAVVCGSTAASAPDDAEGMPGRIGEDPPPVLMRLVMSLACSQLQQPGLRLVQVRDVEAKVKLLGNGLIRPARRPVVVDPLKAYEESIRTVETGKVSVRLRVRLKAGGLLIEHRQSQWIRAV